MEIYNLLTSLGLSMAFGVASTILIIVFVSLTFKKKKV